MSNVADLTGMTFGKWTVLGKSSKKKYYLECKCECGLVKDVCQYSLTQSKGCKKCSSAGINNPSYSHGMNGTKTYRCWYNIIDRCTNKNNSGFIYYGGRGIKVCDEWLKFENFYKDMGEAPDGLEIDRIDVNGNYEPSNCRWVTRSVNNRNRRKKPNTTSKFVGISLDKSANKYKAEISISNKSYNLGRFTSEVDAANEYERAKLELETLNQITIKRRNKTIVVKF